MVMNRVLIGLVFLMNYFMKINDDKFIEIKSRAENFYKLIGQIYCPYFREKINFNAKGLDHIKMKGWSKARNKNDQYMRLKLIDLAPEVVRLTHTLQGYAEGKEFERKKINSRWENILTIVYYFEFIAVINGIRVKIIIKQLPGGEKFFWSIIPFWRMNQDGTKKILSEGKPSED